jgi:hypothetical protein
MLIYPDKAHYDVVLVNIPSTFYSKNETKVNSHQYARTIPPLGLGYIGTHLINNGYAVGILDAEQNT